MFLFYENCFACFRFIFISYAKVSQNLIVGKKAQTGGIVT